MGALYSRILPSLFMTLTTFRCRTMQFPMALVCLFLGDCRVFLFLTIEEEESLLVLYLKQVVVENALLGL